MKKISSSWTGFIKNVLPPVWFGVLGLVAFVGFTRGPTAEFRAIALIAPCVLAVFGLVVMKKVVWSLVDEVYDCGDFLLVKDRGKEHRIPLADIMNVDGAFAANSPRITLRLMDGSASTSLGAEVAFAPPIHLTLSPLAKHPLAENLIVRVNQARSNRVGRADGRMP